MSNTYWSTYFQFTEELYKSRALRFRDDNAGQWLNLLQCEEGNKILEVGCGGGIFCHRIKKHLKDAEVTGIDLDSGHIDYAKDKSKELNLDCRFLAGDATNLPFENNSFDIVFSHTVASFCEPNAFIYEQKRVLKSGGKCLILFAVNHDKRIEDWVPDDSCEEKSLFDKIWSEAEKNQISNIKNYETEISNYFKLLEKFEFKNVMLDTLSAVQYCPDSANVNEELAISQINEERLSELCSVHKARNLAPTALTDSEFDLMIKMINRRFDKRINEYKHGIKKWDWRVGTVIAISGVKK